MTTADTIVINPSLEQEELPSVGGLGKSASSQSLRDCVEETMDNYFRNLDGQPVSDVYDMVLAEVEAPMLEVIMRYTRQNQTKASEILGLNRGTLRKKLKRYGLL